MTFKNINERFSAIVGEYFDKGYTINAGTMSGLQGEVAKVDMTNGEEILRIRIEDESGGLREPRTMNIIVGKNTDKIRPHRNDVMTGIWNNHLTEIYRETYYALDNYGRCAFGTKEEAEKCREIRWERQRNNNDEWYQLIPLSDAARKIALKFIHRRYYSSYKLSDIERVYKDIRFNRVKYYVVARGKSFRLS